ncbi:hypothetical protein [Methylopila sp. M107]|uniref:hypothetical protein n=1 Tax=Methylopila sp. M107 TaxID=1101190 RepID=UPI000362DE70|nr:hypothetical protein [Methylopila sp. M107]
MCDLLLLSAFVSAAELDFERELYRSKWFEYRFMSPEEATRLFTEAYVKIYRDIWRQEFDVTAASSKQAIAAGGLYHNHREFALMWGARQAADALGAPYEVHIRHAMEIKLRLGWKKPPRPNQLCGIKKADRMLPALQKRWEDRSETMPFIGMPIYRSENFYGFHAQLDHQAFVLDRLGKHGHRVWAAGSVAIAQRLIPIEKIGEKWGEDFAARATDEGRRETDAPVVELAEGAALPCCFGRNDEVSETCGSCPAAARCRIVSNLTTRVVEAKYGSADPVKARAANQNADRQRRFRQRRAEKRAADKAAAAAATPASDIAA